MPYGAQAASSAARTRAFSTVTGQRMSSVSVTVSPSVRSSPGFTVSAPLCASENAQPRPAPSLSMPMQFT